MSMYNCSEINRYQNVINQGGHPIALVSMVTTLCEESLVCCSGAGLVRGEFFFFFFFTYSIFKGCFDRDSSTDQFYLLKQMF